MMVDGILWSNRDNRCLIWKKTTILWVIHDDHHHRGSWYQSNMDQSTEKARNLCLEVSKKQTKNKNNRIVLLPTKSMIIKWNYILDGKSKKERKFLKIEIDSGIFCMFVFDRDNLIVIQFFTNNEQQTNSEFSSFFFPKFWFILKTNLFFSVFFFCW